MVWIRLKKHNILQIGNRNHFYVELIFWVLDRELMAHLKLNYKHCTKIGSIQFWVWPRTEDRDIVDIAIFAFRACLSCLGAREEFECRCYTRSSNWSKRYNSCSGRRSPTLIGFPGNCSRRNCTFTCERILHNHLCFTNSISLWLELYLCTSSF